MGYGQLTIDRVDTALILNEKYDEIVNSLLSVMSLFSFSSESGATITDGLNLTEDDVISSQIETVYDIRFAAMIKFQNWFDFIQNGTLDIEQENSGSSLISIFDSSNPSSVYVLPGELSNNPLNLSDNIINPSQILSQIESQTSEEFWSLVDQGFYFPVVNVDDAYVNTALEPFPRDQIQNLYTNWYLETERVYDVDVSSNLAENVSPGGIIGLIQGDNNFALRTDLVTNVNTQQNLSRSFTNLVNNAAASGPITAGQAANSLNATYLQALQESPNNSNNQYSAGSNAQQVSYSATPSIFNKIAGSDKLSLSTNGSNVQSLTAYRNTNSSKQISAIVKRQLPITAGGVVGNAEDTLINQQLIANVTQRIYLDGSVENVTRSSNGFSTSSTKLRSSKRSTRQKRLKIGEVSIVGNSSTGLTLSSSIVYSRSGNQSFPTGWLGTEQFSGTGYDEWSIGVGTTLFTLSLDDDDGYDSFFPGTAYESAGIEEFDDGWSESVSPYARKEDNTAWKEDLSSQIGGGVTKFKTTYDFIGGSLKVYWNGQEQIEGLTFIEGADGKSFTTTFTPAVGQNLSVVYDRFYKNQESIYEGQGERRSFYERRSERRERRRQRRASRRFGTGGY